MVKTVYTASVVGLSAEIVEVQADVSNGLPTTNIVGLPDTAVKESKERVKSAIKNSGGLYPQSRVAVNLAPADIPKIGSHFDLPIAMAIILASEGINFSTKNKLFIGELGLAGEIKEVSGVLAMCIAAKRLGFEEVFVPFQNAKEASLVKGIKIVPATTLDEICKHLLGIKEIYFK